MRNPYVVMHRIHPPESVEHLPGGRGYLISSAAMHQVMKRDWCERRKTAAYDLPANMNCGFEREPDAR